MTTEPVETTIDAGVLKGVDTLFDGYAQLSPADTLLVIYTPDCREQASLLILAARDRGVAATALGMAPVEDPGFRERLRAALPSREGLTGRLVIITIERDTMSHAPILRHEVDVYGDQVLPIRIINGSWDFFRLALGPTPAELSAINAGLLHRFLAAKHLAVTTSSGSELEITLDNDRYRWLSNRGIWRPGHFVILPAGEVATYPASVTGRFVADGAFNVNKAVQLDARLGESPLTVDLKDGDVVSHSCADEKIAKLFGRCIQVDHGNHVGELGFGTNIGIDDFIGMNSHINERHPGIHLGFGQHGQLPDAVDYYTDIHMDLISTDVTIHIDGDPIPLTSRELAPSTLPHPTNVSDEDIDSNCCGARTPHV
ncbi:hypothetical protein [Streptomyces sp. NBC_01012]|uniref:hypothetical protein n=1 Tax=Streptomyces sp. NBC_01012 TaxID=2903717 RepID=UPI00386C111C|nr:hypothetical protein OG623_21965 [Streptomyces sp. NBC_01012]